MRTKTKVTYTLPISVVREVRMLATEKGRNKSQIVTEILQTVLSTRKSYIQYELLRTGQEFNRTKLQAENFNLKDDVLEQLRAGR